jgi:uncharacterized protein (DUF433 family)
MGTPNNKPRVVVDPNVCHGKPIIAGTRVPIASILAAIAGGDDVAQVATDYGVTVEDVRAAVSYANSILSQERHYSIRANAS